MNIILKLGMYYIDNFIKELPSMNAYQPYQW